MTLNELGMQYLDEERRIRERIDELRLTLTTLRGRERVETEQRLTALYSMALDTHRIGVYLMNYYEGEVTGDVYSTFVS